MLKTGIGFKINNLISKNKETKIFVAKELKITRQTLDDYINEKTSITVDKLYQLAALFNYNVFEFFIEDKAIIDGDGMDKAFENLKKELKKYIDGKVK